MKNLSTGLLATALLSGLLLTAASAMTPEKLRCEYRTNPLGIDATAPRLSWELQAEERGQRQTAFQILVASSEEKLASEVGDLWDSGRVKTDRMNQIEYEGKPLASRQRCFWEVRVWDRDGKSSGWSKLASWSMGLLQSGDWKASWIGMELPNSVEVPAAASVAEKGANRSLVEQSTETEGCALPSYLRRSFQVEKPIRRATAQVTALGLYELRLNGARVGDHLLAPEWTDYRKRVQYQTFDVTRQIRQGANAVGVVLGNGWYCGNWQHWKPKLKPIYGISPCARVQIEIETDDGTVRTIASDASWRGTSDGPLRMSGIYEGETYDARREMPGWDTSPFDDSAWHVVTETAPVCGPLVWQRGEPIRALQTYKPVAITEPKPGVYVFAFDQNIAGWCRFQFRGKAGSTIELQHGEMRNPDGTVFTGNLCVVSQHRAQLDRYTFRRDGVETFEPHFTYHGFQYVEVRGLLAKPDLDSLTGVAFHSDCPEVGSFTCSEPLLNRLALNILQSQRANYMGVPTDCPQRNERCGYTGDAQFFMKAAVYNMDVAAFFNRWLVDVCEDSQLPDGHFADHAPTFGPGDGPNIGWADAGIICPYQIYRTYGDTRIIREHYVAMKRYLDWLRQNSADHLFTGHVGNGDWLNTGGGATKPVIGTAYAAFDFHLMAEMAEAIGEKEDATAFRTEAARFSEAFANAFITPEGGIKNCSQTGYSLAFTMGLIPDAIRERAGESFLGEMQRFDWHPRTGFIGTPRLLPALHLAGQDDAAYRVLLTKTVPSWLYPVSVGATTIWERWDGWDGVHPRGGMNSLNHYAFGSVGEYLFGMIGGIQPELPGYQKIRIEPVIRDGLTWATTRYASVRGTIATTWRKVGGTLTFDLAIPANTTATVFVPAKTADDVMESGKPAGQSEGLKFLRIEGGAAVYDVESGHYSFKSNIR